MKDKSLTTQFMAFAGAAARPVPKKRLASARPPAQPGTRYEDDPYTWALEQCTLLEARAFDQLDIVNLLDEVGDVARREYDKLQSALEVLLMHMLKWDHQPSHRTASWEISIATQRIRAEKQLRENPGLRSRLAEAVRDGFRIARLDAAREMGTEASVLPAECPYDWDAIMNRQHTRNDF